jgi:outer membrane protein insertion porin family
VRTLGFLALLALAACDDEVIPPRVAPKLAVKESTPTERRELACQAKQLPSPPNIKATEGVTDAPRGAVAQIDVAGATDDAKVKSLIAITPGEPFTGDKVQSALRRIYELGEYDDVRVDAVPASSNGVALRFTLTKRPALGEVVIHGGTVLPGPELENAFHATSGAKYDPAALVATRTSLVQSLRQKGYQDATLSVVGERATDGKVDLCIDLREGNKVTLDTISFNGLKNVKEEELKPLIDTDKGTVNAPGGVLDPAKIDDAIAKMAEVLDAHGLAKGTIQTRSTRTGDKLSLVFEVEEGPVITLRRYEVKGEMVTDAATYKKALSLKSKDPFSRAKLLADIQKIGEIHDKKGRKDLQVQPQTQVDDKNNTVDVILMIIDPAKLKQSPPPPPPANKK